MMAHPTGSWPSVARLLVLTAVTAAALAVAELPPAEHDEHSLLFSPDTTSSAESMPGFSTANTISRGSSSNRITNSSSNPAKVHSNGSNRSSETSSSNNSKKLISSSSSNSWREGRQLSSGGSSSSRQLSLSSQDESTLLRKALPALLALSMFAAGLWGSYWKSSRLVVGPPGPPGANGPDGYTGGPGAPGSIGPAITLIDLRRSLSSPDQREQLINFDNVKEYLSAAYRRLLPSSGGEGGT